MKEERSRSKAWATGIGFAIAAWPFLKWLGVVVGIPGMIEDLGTWSEWLKKAPWGTILPLVVGLSIVTWANWRPIRDRFKGKNPEGSDLPVPESEAGAEKPNNLLVDDDDDAQFAAKAVDLSGRLFEFIASADCDFRAAFAHDTQKKFESRFWMLLVEMREKLLRRGYDPEFAHSLTPSQVTTTDCIRRIAKHLADVPGGLYQGPDYDADVERDAL